MDSYKGVTMERRRSSSMVWALALILLGVALLVVQLVPGLAVWVSNGRGWPLIVVGVGVFLLVIGLAAGAPGMAVPACIVGGIGALLYWQNLTGNWASWAYAWTLIPAFVGVGLIVAGLLTGNWREVRAGLWQVLIGLILFGIFASFLGGLGLLGLYWPLLLIGLGLLLMARALVWPRPGRGEPAAAGPTGRHLGRAARQRRREWAQEAREAAVPLGDAGRARIRIRHGAGRLEVRGGAAPGQLVGGSFAGGLDVRTQRQGDLLDVEMRTPAQGWPLPWDWAGTLDWSCRLTDQVPLELDLEAGANETQLDLSALRVTELHVKTGASSTEIVLPAAAGYTHARIEAGAAAIKVRVPEGVAARIRVGGALAGVDVDTLRFPRVGDLYQSAGYDTAANRVEIEAETAVGSLSVR